MSENDICVFLPNHISIQSSEIISHTWLQVENQYAMAKFKKNAY